LSFDYTVGIFWHPKLHPYCGDALRDHVGNLIFRYSNLLEGCLGALNQVHREANQVADLIEI